MSTNIDELARKVAYDEDLKCEWPVCRIRVVMRVLFRHLADMPPDRVERILARFRKPHLVKEGA